MFFFLVTGYIALVAWLKFSCLLLPWRNLFLKVRRRIGSRFSYSEGLSLCLVDGKTSRITALSIKYLDFHRSLVRLLLRVVDSDEKRIETWIV